MMHRPLAFQKRLFRHVQDGCVRCARDIARLLMLCAVVAAPAAWASVDWVVNNHDTGFDPVPAGGDITYVVRVSNNGTTVASATTLTLGVPSSTHFVSATGMSCSGGGAGPTSVSCTVPTLAAGGSAGDSASVNVVIRTTVQGTVTLSASVPTAGDSDATNNAADQQTTVNAGADIALGLSGPASAPSGGTVSYTFTLTNQGPNASENQTLSFPAPTGLAGISAPGCTLSAGTWSCAVTALAVGASTTRSFSGQVVVASGSTLTPSGSVAAVSGPLDPISANNTATFNTSVTAGSDLRITKSRAPAGTLLVGQAVTFTLTPSYSGDVPSNLTVTDTVPANYTVGAVAAAQNGWSCGVAGQTVTCTRAGGTVAGHNVALGQITIPATAASAGVNVLNSASIGAASPTDPDPGNNTGNDGGVTIQAPTVDLRANKTGPNPALAVTGVPFTWSISASNLGNAAFHGTLVMTDAVPGGVTVNAYALNGWSCAPAAPVAGPATVSCMRVYTSGVPLAAGASTPEIGLTATASATGTLVNSMTVSSPDANIPDTHPGNDTVTHTVTASLPGDAADLALLKGASPDPVAAGEVLTYRLEIVNAGPQPAASVTLSDSLTGLINNAVGATGAGFIDAVINPGVATGGNCSSTAQGATGRDLGCTFTSIPACTAASNCPVVTVRVRPGGNGGVRTNSGRVISATTADPDTANNAAIVSSTVTPRADVTVTVTDTPDPVAAGQNLTYVVTATNLANGLSRADAVTTTSTLPHHVTFVSASASAGSCATAPAAGSVTGAGNDQVVCNLGNIDNGAQQTVTIIVRPNTGTRGSTLTHNVTVSTTTVQTDTANDSAGTTTAVSNPVLDLLVNKADSIDPIDVGSDTVYTVTVTNQGPSAAENIVATDTLPTTRLSFQAHTVPSGGTCPTVPAVGSVGGTLVCQVAYLPAGESRSFTVTLRGTAKGVTTNTVGVTANETGLGFETHTGNNTVIESTTVRTRADMEVVSKTPSVATINMREDFTFTVRVRNNVGAGLAEADDVVLTDNLPAGMELTGAPSATVVSGSASLTSCTGTAGATSFTCNLGTVSSGAEVDIVMPVQAVSVTALPHTFTNTASVATSSRDMVPGNNSNSGSVSVNSSSIAGRVFRDFNNDGAQTAGQDTGINGVTLTLSGTSFDAATINRSTTTNVNGEFIFSGLPQGTYEIVQGTVSEAHLVDGSETVGSHGGSAAVNDRISGISLPANTAATGYLFAEVPQARVGLAKAVSAGPTAHADGSFSVTFRLTLRNLGLEALHSVTVTDPLAGAAPLFGSFNPGTPGHGEYRVSAAPSGTCGGLQTGFSGAGANQTVAIVPSLAAGATCTIDSTVLARPTAPLPPVSGLCGARYCNQASVSATGAWSGQTPGDTSDHGTNPDPNGNGIANEAGENDPTPVAPAFNAGIGVAKQVNGQVSVQADGSLLVPMRVVTSNIGNEPLHNVSISDVLAGAAPLFGGFIAGGPAAVLGAGQYTVQAAPVLVGACANGSVNPAYTGSAGQLVLASITQMATAASCTVDFSLRFLPASLTTYTNQAQASASGAYTGSLVNDLSDDGSNPDPNGNGNAGEAGEDDPTPVPVPRIGIAKQAGGVVSHGDGTYSVPFTLTLRNFGHTPLSNVQVNDPIAGALPRFGVYTTDAVPSAGQYTISSGPTVGNQSHGAALTPVAAGAFTGSGAGTALLVAGASSLPNFGANASRAEITFMVRFFPVTPGPFDNTAQAAASPPGGGTVRDDSVSGANPDANGNGDPADDAAPTQVSLNAQAIGVAKRVTGVVQTGVRRYQIAYEVRVQNLSSTVTATYVQISDDLVATFPTAVGRSIAAAPAVSGCTGTVLNADPGYTGSGHNTLLAGNQHLQPGEACNLAFTAEIDFGANPLPSLPQNNQAVATTHQLPGGVQIAADLSDDGTQPDPNGNGHAGDAGENDPTPVSFAAGTLSAVTGKVYLDANHNRIDDDPLVSRRVQGFIVEVLNAAGQVVGSTTTDAGGRYTVAGLFPSTPGNPATFYALRFREPTSGLIYGMAQSNDPTPARNGVIHNGIITQLQLVPGTTTLEQNLPLDPAGVVYDAITRLPVAGASVTLSFGGVPVPGHCVVGGAATQVTGPSGDYQFLLFNPPPGGCPGSGVYSLRVVQPAGYLPPDSTFIPPSPGPFTPPLGNALFPIQAQNTPPTGAQPTTWYTSFNLTLSGNPVTSSQGVVNNHIPLDPILQGAIAMTKGTPLVNVARGALVPYTITARNTLTATLSNIELHDRMPPGFKYVPGSARLDGVAAEPGVNGRLLIWPNLSFAPGQTRSLSMMLVVGAGVGEGEYTNSVWAMNRIAHAQVSNTATASVRIVPDPVFDCAEVIGKVFDDRNANGWQDEGEPGIANVRLATVRGLLVTTDAEGRFHVACADVPQAQRGSNFVMKLDQRTLPSGYRLTTENPRAVRLTRGKMSRLNFGAAIHRVVRLELSDAAFVPGRAEPGAALASALDGLLPVLRQQPAVVRLAYQTDVSGRALTRARMQAVRELLERRWREQGCCYSLQFEEEWFEPGTRQKRSGQ